MKGDEEWNFEKYMALHMRKSGLEGKIKRFPGIMFTVRGKKDKTRRGKGGYDQRVGLIVKCESEFDESYGKFCRLVKKCCKFKL